MPIIPILPNAYEGPPEIDRSHIPAEEMPAFLHVMELLANLALYERRFLLAVYLYEYSVEAAREIADFATLELSLWTTGGWQSMAGRDGALSLYHFGSAIEGLKGSLRPCPALNAKVDNQQLRMAGKIFESAFPGYVAIRHAVAHVADFSQTLTEKMKHAIRGLFKVKGFLSEDPTSIAWLPGNMNGNTYAVSYKGEAFAYDLNRDNADRLRAVKDRVYSAFRAATASNA
jgi:hypothetical protein